MNGARVYCGTSVSHEKARALFPEATLFPPIRRGDTTNCRDELLCIIDGFFSQELSVSPKELVRAIENGCTLVGGASMGALRAAELPHPRVHGVGEIYARFADGRWDRDDEVAVAVCPLTYRSTSDALADVRFFLETRNISEADKTEILRLLETTFFPERCFKDTLRTLHYPEEWALGFEFTQKQKDAEATLIRARELYSVASQ